ncbi:Hypothetical predicted protein [Lecanosticta acicola]|uniref:Carboxylic ester hydrolase n=1 Tax=Lecanosticta acicola TaxID=111012 RepID=A0AAI9EFD9_9PEZI|nr:Hypothetical predicted protein [Lecanosticta acicola]
MLSRLLLLPAAVALTAVTTTLHSKSDCSSLAHPAASSSHNATILNSTYYPANSLNVSGFFNHHPLCEVYGSVPCGSNDSLVFAIWLPDRSGYKGRFMAVGNGGMAGTIDYATMMTQLNSGLGLAVAGGNAGHLASENNDGGGAPGLYLPYLHDKSQVTAWIHDAISLFTPAAKALATDYYNRAPRHSYYYGCSTGGAQGFALAEFHPTLFDGIYAGSPGNWYSHLALSFLWNAQHTNPGLSFGSETEWILQEGNLANVFSIPLLQNLAFDDLQYDSDDFNWASDVAAIDERAGALIDEISADLSPFREHGGKLLTSQGWADPFHAATWRIEHLAQIEGFFGGDVSDFYRLFTIPGGGHCGAASYYPHAPATYHTVSALIEWVEESQKPEAILCSNPPDGSNRTRKLCPWPATAHFSAGNYDDWTSYTCQ